MSAAKKENGEMHEFSSGSQAKPRFHTVDKTELLPASNNKRVIAFVIDAIILACVNKLLMIPFNMIHSTKYSGLAVLLVNLVSILFYWVLLPIAVGATPGKKVMGLRIVREDYDQDVSIGTYLFRELIGRSLSAITLGVGYIIVAFREDRRALHDLMAKTRVVDYRS